MSSLGFKIDRQCPKCYTDRTLLDTSFGLPGYIDPTSKKESGESINVASALPVRVILCPRCHYIEIYHDVGQF
jgi:hypothetical protein